MSGHTVKGTLRIGIDVDGAHHAEFEIRPATLGDNVDALDEVGGDNPLKLSAAIMARQIMRLGTLPKAKITTALLCTLRIEDWNALDAKATELTKKSGPPASG